MSINKNIEDLLNNSPEEIKSYFIVIINRYGFNRLFNKYIKICESCKKFFIVKPSRIKDSRFCSTICWTTSDESKNIVSKTQRISWFNDKVNRSGSNNPNWKGGQKTEYKNRFDKKERKILREAFFIALGKICNVCESTKNIHVHEKIPFRNGGKFVFENVELLCNKCHPQIKYIEAIRKKCFNCINTNKNMNSICYRYICPLYLYSPYKEKRNIYESKTESKIN